MTAQDRRCHRAAWKFVAHGRFLLVAQTDNWKQDIFLAETFEECQFCEPKYTLLVKTRALITVQAARFSKQIPHSIERGVSNCLVVGEGSKMFTHFQIWSLESLSIVQSHCIASNLFLGETNAKVYSRVTVEGKFLKGCFFPPRARVWPRPTGTEEPWDVLCGLSQPLGVPPHWVASPNIRGGEWYLSQLI